MKALSAAVLLLASVASAYAGPFDGSTVMRCRIETVTICSDPKICVQGTAATAALPPVLIVDVPKRRVSGDASGRTVKIVSVGRGPNRLVLHGDEVEMSGTAWNVVIDENTGAMTGAVLTYSGGFLAFGTCQR
jgi:hypothetical protein